MDLSTRYLGMMLKNPLVPSASPLMTKLDNIKKLEDAGAGAVVLHSLFEEQITNEALELHYYTTQGMDSFAEALSYFPEPASYKLGGEEYIDHIRKAKDAVNIPVIASLNGISTGGWTKYAHMMQEAGANAIELNLYYIPTDAEVEAAKLEDLYIEVLRVVKSEVKIPVAVKIHPFFTSIPAIAKRFREAGADGLVLFNRFYQPDIDIEHLDVRSGITLSHSGTNRLALRWISILFGRVNISMAATGGVHTAADAIKLLMAGADVTMMCSALLKNGPGYLATVLKQLNEWLDKHEYNSIEQLKGSMSQRSVAEPAAYERSLYLRELTGYNI